MYRILFITHHNVDEDGRTSLLVDIAKKIGEVFLVSKDNSGKDDHSFSLGEKGFALKKVVSIVKKNKINMVFVDNRMACVEGLVLKLRFPYLKIVQDARELYLYSIKNSFKSNVGNLFERLLMRRAEIVICANEFRAEFMASNFKLKERPLVYENIRYLSGVENKIDEYREKYDWLISKNLPVIISTSGCSVERTNDKLVKEFKTWDDKAILLFVGGETKEDKKIIQDIIEKEKLCNVYILGRVAPTELKFLLSISKIGIVNYGQYDFNNKFCASGKLYEFIYEKLPVVTTTNPPLKALCNQYQIGCADDSYANAIGSVFDKYDYYKNNITEFLKTDWVVVNNKKLYEEIASKLNV